MESTLCSAPVDAALPSRRACDAVIELADISRAFPGPSQVLALRGVSCVIGRGDFVSISGASGSGKSTLLNVLGLLDRPTVGSYKLNGADTSNLNDKQRTFLRGQALGFVFQAFHLLPRRTVFENVMLGMTYTGVPRAERPGRAQIALERVGLTKRAGFYPSTLSGGEKQRAAVARAVAGRPQVLLADEPTGNLDRNTSNDVLTVLEELNCDGLTVVIVTHDPAVAARAGRQFTMSDGHLSEATA